MSTEQRPTMAPLILPFGGKRPTIDPSAFLANAVIIGDVEIGAGSSLWFNVTVRGDVHEIRIGKGTNIQDGSVVHCTTGKFGTYIGDNVLVGHLALLHGCVIEDGAFIGMKACVMDGVVVEAGAMVAAGALVTPGKRVKAGELWGGSPARFIRPLTDEEKLNLTKAGPHYASLARQYLDMPG
ncbi:gamma carbonic anhydrase family protein [Oleisolibacter albus]|uniref:gamma carbonic anhydrase family protein n=1 Tax=Oleisolibacter albus TaxID=2171757 RepID=UPI003B836EA1